MYVIYALVDPRDGKVHYAGMTDDVYKRFIAHLQCSGNNFEKNKWVHEMRAANVMIQMHHLEETEDEQYARQREVYWIKHYLSLDHPLANIASVPYTLAVVESVQISASTQVDLPDKWTLLHVQKLPDLYRKFNSLDKSLAALKLSTSQKNRDYAREILRKQGLMREAK